jgi:hypothetical protein
MVGVARDGGDSRLVVTRLRGQLADLDVALTLAPGPIEAALDAQLAAANRLAAASGARAVVWFVARGGGLAVAIATPADHRLLVREIPPAEPSAVAEAAAVAVRGALRAIGEGGRIGIEVPDGELPPPAVLAGPSPARTTPPAPRALGVTLDIGWQVALEGGADAGAHAVTQRTTVASGPWGILLALSWGPALGHTGAQSGDPAVRIDLSRSSVAAGVERRFGDVALVATAGAVLYRRTTTVTPADLSATPAATTAAFVAGPELRWQWRPSGAAIGVAAAAGLDVAIGAPDLAVARGAELVSIGAVRTLQPRFMAAVFADLR